MQFEPDIVVTNPEKSELLLVVEARVESRGLEGAKANLKKFMSSMGCPVGMVVTPSRAWIFRDRYLAAPNESVQQVAELELMGIPGLESPSPRQSPTDFEQSVQAWLEEIASDEGLTRVPVGIRATVERYILPAVSEGLVRAGHVRPALVA